ncbi:MAG TPA: FAD-dependent oxidoreductase [Actinomycetes bacterium]|jgi:thioredoxin reductase (NADPH)|nr:FAD-dependent oxidoreductase [Actinomycetes bacterium]
MGRPVLLAVDDDPVALGVLRQELDKRYGADYRLICDGDAEAGLRALQRLQADGGQVALVLADQWMPAMTGVTFLTRAHRLHSTAKRALLIDWGDSTTAEPILQAATFDQLDYWISKPTQPADELFHQAVSGFLYEWTRLHRPQFQAVRVVGDQWSARSHELRDLLSRNSIPFGFYPADSDEGRRLLGSAGATAERLPVVVLFDGRVLADPSNAELAEALAVRTHPEAGTYDLAVVGAGPAGLAAAVSGASEGLRTTILEHEAIGGQAGSSSMIRNYLGFPRGVSGAELAERAYQQAWIFRADFVYGQRAVGLRAAGPERVISLSDGDEVASRAVVLATGVSYRRLGVASLEALVGAGVFYGAAAAEAHALRGQQVYVVGGANSAGQAAVHLARYASHVTMLVRGSSLAATMSDYLIQQIHAAPNITIRLGVEAVDGHGDGQLTGLTLRDWQSGATETVPAAALFVLIGAEPHTGWLPQAIRRDRWGFVVTGADLLQDGRPPPGWPLERPPMPFESSMPGVFAVGDVRHGSVKRVAAAVGEGSVAIQLIHQYLNGR